MKAKKSLPKRNKPSEPKEPKLPGRPFLNLKVSHLRPPEPEEPKLPERPLENVDLPEARPTISQHEIVEYVCARDTLLISRLDFERKRAELFYKVRMLCEVAPGSYDVKLAGEDDETVIIIECCSTVPRVMKESLFEK